MSRVELQAYFNSLSPGLSPKSVKLIHGTLRAALNQGLPGQIDFRSFRTMHASLMRRMGGRLEVARDKMGHAGSSGSITLDVYSKSWWEERVDTVTRVVEAVMTEPEERSEESNNARAPKPLRQGANGELWEPYWEP